MSVIKQISVFHDNGWITNDIGADAGNITLSSNIAGSTNLNTALSNILPASQLNINAVVVTDGNKKLTTSNLASSKLSFLSNVTSDIQAQLNYGLPARGGLPTGTDLNNITAQGKYSISGNNTYTNLPTGASFGLLLHITANNTESNSFAVQRLSSDTNTYFRFYANNQWYDWTKMAKDSQFSSYLPLVGGTVTGLITNTRTGNSTSKFATKVSVITSGSTIGTEAYGNDFVCTDSNSLATGFFRQMQNTSGDIYLQMRALNRASASSSAASTYNSLDIGVKKDGTKVVNLDKSSWKSALSLNNNRTTSMTMASSVVGTVNAVKDNSIGTVRFYLSFATTATIAAGALIGTIPSGYRIKTLATIPGVGLTTNNITQGAAFTLKTNGQVINTATNGVLKGGIMVGEYLPA